MEQYLSLIVAILGVIGGILAIIAFFLDRKKKDDAQVSIRHTSKKTIKINTHNGDTYSIHNTTNNNYYNSSTKGREKDDWIVWAFGLIISLFLAVKLELYISLLIIILVIAFALTSIFVFHYNPKYSIRRNEMFYRLFYITLFLEAFICFFTQLFFLYPENLIALKNNITISQIIDFIFAADAQILTYLTCKFISQLFGLLAVITQFSYLYRLFRNKTFIKNIFVYIFTWQFFQALFSFGFVYYVFAKIYNW